MVLTRNGVPSDARLTRAMVTVPPGGEGFAVNASARHRPSASPNLDGPWFVCGTIANRSVLMASG
jgi:hypothetical protein